MAKLVFAADALRPIVKWTVEHAPHTPTYGQQIDPKYWKEGVSVAPGEWPKREQIALEKVEAAIHLVHDQGIYVLSSSAERDLIDATSSRVAYARGFDPSIDDDWWEAARQAVGGDDFVEALPIEWFTPLLDDPEITAVVLHFNRSNIRCSYQRAKRKTH